MILVAGGGGAIACDSAQPSGRPAASTRGSGLRIRDSRGEQPQLCVVEAQRQHSWIGVCAVRMRANRLLHRFSAALSKPVRGGNALATDDRQFVVKTESIVFFWSSLK